MKTASFYLKSFRHGRKKQIATKIAKSTTTTPIYLSEGGMFLAKLRVRFFCLYFSGNLWGMWEHCEKFHQMTIAHCFYRLFSMCVVFLVGSFKIPTIWSQPLRFASIRILRHVDWGISIMNSWKCRKGINIVYETISNFEKHGTKQIFVALLVWKLYDNNDNSNRFDAEIN